MNHYEDHKEHEDKFEIVELLQELGHITGMTGDGVNDAPALKKADCGVAVDGATDAAKSAADIVLTLPGLSVIIDAIKKLRMIFQRMVGGGDLGLRRAPDAGNRPDEDLRLRYCRA